jgi:hypothetical protein
MNAKKGGVILDKLMPEYLVFIFGLVVPKQFVPAPFDKSIQSIPQKVHTVFITVSQENVNLYT